MTPFQCDICHFRNIQKRDPLINSAGDMRLMQDIRHANINAVWARETSTVSANLAQVRRLERMGREIFNLTSVTAPMGPFPLEDTFGMAIAVVLLRRSLDPGRNEDYIQFSTACKFRSAYSNAWHASSNVSQISAMAYESTKTYATTCPTYGYWFGRFILGCHKRMGDKVIQDFALSRTIFKAMLVHLESDWKASLSDEDRDEIVEFACALIAGFLVGLRGEEIVKMDSSGLLKYIDVGNYMRNSRMWLFR